MNSVDVSVVIPVHNGECFVREALDSVLLQTGFSLQVIVVDNRSTDRTRETVAAYGNPVILTSEDQPGAASARNTGVRLATGKYLAFLDADDVWLPGKLQRQIHELESRPDASILFSHCREFHDSGLSLEQMAKFPCRPEPYPFIAASTCVLAREAFQKAGDFPDALAGEFIAWYGWAQSLGLPGFVLPDVLLRRRIHATNSTRDRQALAGFPKAAKWLLDRRRQALQTSNS